MSALTTNRDTKERVPAFRRYLVTPGEIMYAGGIAALNTATGKIEMASDKASLKVIGRSEQYIDNSEGKNPLCEAKAGCFLFANSAANPVTVASIGAKCYVEDDQTVSSSGGTNNLVAGVVFDVSEAGVWVEIQPYMSI